MDRIVAVPAEDSPVLLAEHKSSPLLADITQGLSLFCRGEGEAAVLAGKLVGVVDAAVAGVAESGLVRAAENRGLIPAAYIALYLHLRDEIWVVVNGEEVWTL